MVYDRDIASLDIAGCAQAMVERAKQVREPLRRFAVKEPDHRHRRLQRARRKRPRGSRATEQRDELATFHGAIPPVRSTQRIAHVSYGGRLLRCGSQVESDAQAWAIVRKVIE